MEFEIRFDKASLSEPFLGEDGFLKAKVKLTKPGIYPYLLSNGIVRKEVKLPEELFKESVLTSLNGAPVTEDHPVLEGGFVNSKNYSKLVRGVITNPRIEDNFIVADETIFDQSLIDLVMQGEKREVSIGFKSAIDLVSGEFNGDRFDAIQRSIEVNHVAHVNKGNAGKEARIILDSNFNYGILQRSDFMPNPNIPVTETEPGWVQKIIDTITNLFKEKDSQPKTEIEVETPATNPVPNNNPTEIATLKEAIAKLQALISGQATEPKLDKSIDDAVKERIVLLDSARVIVPEIKLDSLEDSAIKRAVIKKVLDKDMRLDSSTSEVDAFYLAALEVAKRNAVSRNSEQEPRLDKSTVEALKSKRLNLYREV